MSLLELTKRLAEVVTKGRRIESVRSLDADSGELAAVMLRGTVLGDVWLIADAETLVEQPDIIRSALPVFFFDEVETLRGMAPEELKAVGMMKATFPTGRVLQ